jgi:putative ABC transport system ATP-binding protein
VSDSSGGMADSVAGDHAALLEAIGVWKWPTRDRSRHPVLQDVSMSVSAGSWTHISGPSGSGKTTLLMLLGALDIPSRGRLIFEGNDLTHYSDHALARLRRRTGVVFQEYALIPRLSVLENITYPLIPRGFEQKWMRQRALDTLESVGLAGYEARRPEELSGGERQRAAFARAIAGDPAVLLADEPTSNLDSASAALIVQILTELHANGGTLIVASHDPALAELASQQYELRNGSLIEKTKGDQS